MSATSVSDNSNLTFFILPFIFTFVLLNIKHRKFQVLLSSSTPDTISISENHAVPIQLSAYPPNLNPIFTSFLFFESNKNSTFVQSDVPTTLSDFSTVSPTHI